MRRDFSEKIQGLIIGSRIVKAVADPIYDLLNRLFQETPLRPLKLLASGVWLNHPLHPLLTDVPVGAWTVALVLELVALVFAVPNLGLASAIAIGLGILAALAAIATGLMDWMDVDPPEKAVGLVHAALNTTSTILFLVAAIMLWQSNWSISLAQFVVLAVAYVIIASGAFLSGDLVYRLGVMNNRNAYRKGPKDFTPTIALNELAENQPKRVEVKGQPIMLVRRGDKVYAVGAVCSHYGGPLERGEVVGNTIKCPVHYSRFALQDGRVKEGPSTAPVPAYDTQVVAGQVQVRKASGN
jgi:nitrite reductase/ring-hydroxylating ferredoxin subunit/uncharacterized membrane protein